MYVNSGEQLRRDIKLFTWPSKFIAPKPKLEFGSDFYHKFSPLQYMKPVVAYKMLELLKQQPHAEQLYMVTTPKRKKLRRQQPAVVTNQAEQETCVLRTEGQETSINGKTQV